MICSYSLEFQNGKSIRIPVQFALKPSNLVNMRQAQIFLLHPQLASRIKFLQISRKHSNLGMHQENILHFDGCLKNVSIIEKYS